MDMVTLTKGAIADISNGVTDASRPVVQVADLRLVQTAQNTAERFRMMLSDGVHAQQAMLATQMNEMVKTGLLKKGSVVRLNEFICNVIQNRKIIIVLKLDVVTDACDIIGEPKNYESGSTATQARSPLPTSTGVHSSANVGNVQSNSGSLGLGGQTATGGPYMHPKSDPVARGQSAGGSFTAQNPSNSVPYSRAGSDTRTYGGSPQNLNYNQRFQNSGTGTPNPPGSTYGQPPSTYQQARPPPLYQNRGPIAKNEAPARITPIAALNPYQGRWTIKARVTAKAELRRYNNPKGEGKVFSFDLLDSDGGEIRVTCFNNVADQFFDKIEAGKVYLVSEGSIKPAQKNFNHLNNDFEITLGSTSTVQPCLEEDNAIPKQNFNFRAISDVETTENNSMVDLIGVVSSINIPTTIIRKNGTEAVKRTLVLKDMSGRSVEITFWGNFCNVEGQQLQSMCDSGQSPVLAIKSGRVSDFSGKSVGTISTSQLIIDPDLPEAQRLKEWYNAEGKNVASLSISKEMMAMGRADVRKFVSQIKDEGLGRSEKPDWISIKATVSFIKSDSFCYTACPLTIVDRPCMKKVINNGDGQWHCDRCDRSFPECDYRYLLNLQIQDHTGVTWVTTFQEGGEQIMGLPAKDLYLLKYEEQDDARFGEIIRGVLFSQYMFKLKVKEETFSDEQRIKSTVVKAESVNPSSESCYLLSEIDKLTAGDPSEALGKPVNAPSDSGTYYDRYANMQASGSSLGISNHVGNYGVEGPPQHVSPFGNVTGYGGGVARAQAFCSSCGSAGHDPQNCPRLMGGLAQPSGGGSTNRAYTPMGGLAKPSGGGSTSISSYTSTGGGNAYGGSSGNCYKCQQPGHWARDCPGLNSSTSVYGGAGSGQYGFPRQQMGGY